MKIEVAYKRISAHIKLLFVKNDRFFILIGAKLWVIDYSGRLFPDIDASNIDIAQINTRGRLVFLATGTHEIFTCRLGSSTLVRTPVMFSAIRFGRHILYSHGKSLFVLADSAKMLSKHLCSFGDDIYDVAYTRRRIFAIVATKVLSAHWDPATAIDASSFVSIGFLSGISCKKLHTNSLHILIAETDNYLISLFPNAPILITKPGFCYDFSFTKYHAVFLSESILIVSLFSGSVEKVVRLTAFSSVFDTKTNKLWVYSNSLFEITIEEPADTISKHLAGQHMFRHAIRASQGSTDIIGMYVVHLFEKKQPQRALRYFDLLREPLYFSEKQLIENAEQGRAVSPVEFSCRLAENVEVPEHVFLKFLFKRAIVSGEHVEFLSRMLFLRKKFGLFARLTKTLSADSSKITYLEGIDYSKCTPDEKKAVDRYNMYRNPGKLVLQKLEDKKHSCARKAFLWAHRKQKIKKSEYRDLGLLLARVKSKSITRAFVEALGSECLSAMQNNKAYMNLAYYVRFSKSILDDMQHIFRMAESIPSKIHRKVLAALERKLSPEGRFEPFLRTFELIVSGKLEAQSNYKL